MLVKLIHEPQLRDTFLHTSPRVFQSIANKGRSGEHFTEQGIPIALTDLNDPDCEPMYYWLVADERIFDTERPIVKGNSGLFKNSKIISWVIQRVDALMASRVVLSAKAGDYDILAQNAQPLIDHVFLEQVRVVQTQQEICIMLGKTSIRLAVHQIIPEAGFAMLGKNCELEIVPMGECSESSNGSDCFRVQKEARVRLCCSSSLTVPDLQSEPCVDRDMIRRLGWQSKDRANAADHVTLKLSLKGREEHLTFKILPNLSSSESVFVPRDIIVQLRVPVHSWVLISPSKIGTDHVDPEIPAEYLDDSYAGTACEESCRLEKAFSALFSQKSSTPIGLILEGESQVGKTTLIQQIIYEGSLCTPTVYYDASVMGDLGNINDFSQKLDEMTRLTLECAPCVLVFDHAETPLSSLDEHYPDEDKFIHEQVCQMFLSRVMLLHQWHCPVVLVTQLANILNPILREVFCILDRIQPPGEDRRLQLLSKHFSQDQINIFELVSRTKGLLPRQISILRIKNFNSILSAVSALSVDDTLAITWDSIKGFDALKKELEETLLWPIKYQRLYERNKLPLNSGVLLHGASGTGKTLLGRAFTQMLQSKYGVNVIRVAGPELLGKYVGSSEKAVRDVFERANLSKPALILLEEVDALAPRRGMDNTGSTDRVVNQLLTELDGTGDRAGVFVLAISSRPDLIDPALLRPGRVGKHLEVSLPSHKARLEILKSLSPPHLANDGVLWEQVARETENFAPAHLRGILTDAFFTARTRGDSIQPSDVLDALVIAQQHPSLISTERSLQRRISSCNQTIPRQRQTYA